MTPFTLGRPQLKAALARVWRGPMTLQFGIAPETAWLLHDVSPAVLAVLESCDGTRTLANVVDAARGHGLSPEHVLSLLDTLGRAGVLDDAAAGDVALRGVPVAERRRLEPEHAALTIAHHAAGAAVDVLARRRAARVDIEGDARIVPLLAALFAAAGVGHVTVASAAETTSYDALPGGVSVTDEKRPLADVTADAVARARCGPATSVLPPRADLRVLAPRAALIDPQFARAASADGVPLLAVHARELSGVVGPLVVAGETACLHCLDLHRSDRDPDWPLVAAQLANRRGVPPQPVALLTILAGHTLAQGLAFLDGIDTVAARNGTLELAPPDWRVRRRGWLPHRECGCVWPAAEEAATLFPPGMASVRALG